MENQENLNELHENETINQTPTPIDEPIGDSENPTVQQPSPPQPNLNEEIKNLISGELKKAITEAVSQAYIKGRNDVINEIHKTGKSSVHNSINRLLWNEIYRKTIDALHTGRFRNIPHALTHVLVTEKASRFFISHQQAMRLFSSNRPTLKNSKQ